MSNFVSECRHLLTFASANVRRYVLLTVLLNHETAYLSTLLILVHLVAWAVQFFPRGGLTYHLRQLLHYCSEEVLSWLSAAGGEGLKLPLSGSIHFPTLYWLVITVCYLS